MFSSFFLSSGYYLIVITKRKKIGSLYPGLLFQQKKVSDEKYSQATFWQIAETELIPCEYEKNLSLDFLNDENRYLELIGNFLSCTSMYFSYDYDLTQSVQKQFLNVTDITTIAETVNTLI